MPDKTDAYDYKTAEKNFECDVDRMVSEGLGGGTVNHSNQTGKIEETSELVREEPPHRSQKSLKNDR